MGEDNLCPLLVELQIDSTQCKLVGTFLKEIKLEISFDLDILFLGIILKELKTSYHSAMCIFMFIAAKFIIAKSWKQPIGP